MSYILLTCKQEIKIKAGFSCHLFFNQENAEVTLAAENKVRFHLHVMPSITNLQLLLREKETTKYQKATVFTAEGVNSRAGDLLKEKDQNWMWHRCDMWTVIIGEIICAKDHEVQSSINKPVFQSRKIFISFFKDNVQILNLSKQGSCSSHAKTSEMLIRKLLKSSFHFRKPSISASTERCFVFRWICFAFKHDLSCKQFHMRYFWT